MRILRKMSAPGSEALTTIGSSSLLTSQDNWKLMESIQKRAFEAGMRIWARLESEMGLDSNTATEVVDGTIKQYLVGNVLFSTIKEIETAKLVVEEIKPSYVRIQRAGFSSFVGNAFEKVSREYGIETRIDEPRTLSIVHNFVARNGWSKYLLNCLENRSLFHNGKCADESAPRVLFNVPYWNWLTAVKPVIDEMLQSSDQIFVLTDGHAPQGFKPLNLKACTGEPSDLKEEIEKILQNYRGKRETDSFQSIFEWKGMNLWNLVVDQLDLIFEKLLPLMPDHIAFCRTVIDTTKPDILVISTMPRSYELGNIDLVCKLRHIPVLKIQHGIFDPFEELFVRPLLFDKIACGGPYWKMKYEEKGAPLDTIVVTGWPKYDEYADAKPAHTKAERRTILYLGQGGVLYESGMKALTRIAGILDATETTLLIKPHPAEEIKQYSRYLAQHRRVAILDPRANLRSCLERSDVVITHTSTGGVEAVLLGKRLLCLNLDRVRRFVTDMYVESGVAEEIVDMDQLVKWIKIMDDIESTEDTCTTRNKFISDMVYLVDGKASRRIVDLIHEMIRVAPNSNGRVGFNRLESAQVRRVR